MIEDHGRVHGGRGGGFQGSGRAVTQVAGLDLCGLSLAVQAAVLSLYLPPADPHLEALPAALSTLGPVAKVGPATVD